MNSALALLLCSAAVSASVEAQDRELSLPWVFADHMVLQRGRAIPLEGRSQSGSEVRVSFGSFSATATADAEGQWRVEMPAMDASAIGRTLRVEAAEEVLEVHDVAVGEVWLCAGQSNMDFPLARAVGGPRALASLGDAGLLRLCNRSGSPDGSARPLGQDELERMTAGDFYSGDWEGAQGESASAFSAVGFFMGRALVEELKVPVGLIDVSVGGSTLEGWVSREALRASPGLAPLLGDYLNSPLTHPFIKGRAALQLGDGLADGKPARHFFEPGYLYGAGIASLAPFPVRGVAWYQGESNAHRPGLAGQLFRTLVEDWRRAWGQAELPFLTVQLPAMGRATWPAFRAAQESWCEEPGVDMVVTIDLGDPVDVHPPDKRPVGERLARLALGSVYGRKISARGPRLESLEGQGDRLLARFVTSSGLRWGAGRGATGFEVAEEGGPYYPARAAIEGNHVILSSPEVDRPAAVRYAYAPDPDWSLVDGDGLPAAPFGNTGPASSEARTIRLYLLTGQSNSLGTTADPSASVTAPPAHPADAHIPMVWSNRSTRAGDGAAALIGASGKEAVSLTVQQGEGANASFWGPEFGFARRLYAEGERDFAIVKASRGGGGSGHWDRDGGSGDMYRHVVETAQVAIRALEGEGQVEVAALLYLQGESDSEAEAALAGERLQTLVRNLRADLPRAAQMRALVAGIAAPGKRRDVVRQGQRAACAEDAAMVYISTLDLRPRLYDGLHFNRQAKIEIGRRLARAWLDLGGAPAWRAARESK